MTTTNAMMIVALEAAATFTLTLSFGIVQYYGGLPPTQGGCRDQIALSSTALLVDNDNNSGGHGGSGGGYNEFYM